MVDKNNFPKHHKNRPDKFAYLDKAYEKEPDPNMPKHLGAMNGWYNKETKQTDYPKEYKFCIRKRIKNPHKLKVKELGRCYTEYHCPICNITWTIDSSD